MSEWLKLESGDYINTAWCERLVHEDGRWLCTTAFNPRTYVIAEGEVEKLLGEACEWCGKPISETEEDVASRGR